MLLRFAVPSKHVFPTPEEIENEVKECRRKNFERQGGRRTLRTWSVTPREEIEDDAEECRRHDFKRQEEVQEGVRRLNTGTTVSMEMEDLSDE